MRIAAVAHAVPSEIVDNDEVIRRVRAANADRFTSDDLDGFETRIRAQWRISGSMERHVAEAGEPALGFAVAAAKQALDEAGVAPSELDLIIYGGIGRGWLEPATAPCIQHAIRATNATAFDVLDACAGWVRAMEVAKALLASRGWRHALVVNCEIGMVGSARLDLPCAAEAESGFAALTVGEAATATVVTHDPDSDYYAVFRTFAEHFDLCMIPLDNIGRFALTPPSVVGASGQFVVDSNRLIGFAVRRIGDLYRSDPTISAGGYSIVLTHSASSRASALLMRTCGLPDSLSFDIHPRFGNVSSASIPLAISLALREGRLLRGERVLAIIGSAGVTIALVSFTF